VAASLTVTVEEADNLQPQYNNTRITRHTVYVLLGYALSLKKKPGTRIMPHNSNKNRAI